MRELTAIAEARAEIARGALVAWNHSGGKDSQAGLILLLEEVPRAQLLVVHATLGEVEWPGALELAREQAHAAGLPFIVAEARKTFLGMVEHRHATRPGVPSWPSAAHRQCTSDLKRGPIEREVRRYAAERGINLIVNAMGMRAQESPRRAKLVPWGRNEGKCVAGRTWLNWLPLHSLTTADVFATIRGAGQRPHHAYALGNERLSCTFCILGSANDARVGAIARPDLYERYVRLEERTGYTMHQSRKSLPVLTGLSVAEAYAAHAKEAA